MEMDESVVEEKLSFGMLGLSFYSKLDWGSYTVSVAKAAFRGIGTFTRSVSFFLLGLFFVFGWHSFAWGAVVSGGWVGSGQGYF